VSRATDLNWFLFVLHSFSYDCSSFENHNRSKCLFSGNSYELGSQIDNDLVESSCSVGCVCRAGYDNKVKFNCAHYDCAEFFGFGRPAPDCILQYKLNGCCSTGKVCGEAKEALAKCVWNGKTYYEGQSIDTEESCYSCVCGKGFESKPVKENKHCKKINCLIDLHYGDRFQDGCVPIYYGRETW
jgi:hypothetical protein